MPRFGATEKSSAPVRMGLRPRGILCNSGGMNVEPTEADARYMAAKGYLQATRVIAASPLLSDEDQAALTVLPMHMLIGFALELYLKAWLLGAGRTSVVVREWKHDIPTLFLEARIEGLPLIPLLDQLVETIGIDHVKLSYRYVSPGQELSVVTAWPLTFEILGELDAAVGARLEAIKLL